VRAFLIIFSITVGQFVCAQSYGDTTSIDKNDTTLYLYPKAKYMFETYLVFSPQFQLSSAGNQWGAEVYLMQGACHIGCVGSGIGLGYHHNFEHNKQRFTLSFASASSVIIMGLDGRLDLNLSRWEDKSSVSLKPGLGLALMHFYFHYGYDIQFSDENRDFTRHSLSIQTYIPFARLPIRFSKR
jgi:hypothetical protein